MLTVIILRFSLAAEFPKTYYLHLNDALFLGAMMITSLNLIFGIILNSTFQKGEKAAIRIGEKRIEIITVLVAICLVAGSFIRSF